VAGRARMSWWRASWRSRRGGPGAGALLRHACVVARYQAKQERNDERTGDVDAMLCRI